MYVNFPVSRIVQYIRVWKTLYLEFNISWTILFINFVLHQSMQNYLNNNLSKFQKKILRKCIWWYKYLKSFILKALRQVSYWIPNVVGITMESILSNKFSWRNFFKGWFPHCLTLNLQKRIAFLTQLKSG